MRRIILFVLLSIIFTYSESAAQSTAEPDSIIARIGVFQNEIQHLRNQLPGMSGEDSLIISYELGYARLQALNQVYALIDHLIANKDLSKIRPEEQNILDAVPSSLLHVEAAASNSLKLLRAQRESISPSKLGEFEENIAEKMKKVTEIQNHIYNYIQAMTTLGQPHSKLEAHLQKEVTSRVRILIGRLRIALKSQAALVRRIPKPATGDDIVLLNAANIRVDAAVANTRAMIALMKSMKLDSTAHETFLIESTGRLTSTDLASGALMRYLNNWFQGLLNYLKNNGLNIGMKTLIVVGLLVLFRYMGKLASKLIIASIDASRFRPSRLLRNMIQNMSSKIVMLIGILIALSQLDISLGPMLAGLGVVGFIVGFALQDTLANFASGIMILFYRPFDVGDMVETGAVFGKVKHMSLVSTTILTIDNQTLVVPNNMIWGNVIKNVTAQNLRRVDLVFGISYTDDIPKVENILMEILVANKMVLKTPAPVVKLHELADSSVNFVVRPWVRTADYWDVHWDVTREVKMQFDAKNVSIPFPQQDVHLFGNKTD